MSSAAATPEEVATGFPRQYARTYHFTLGVPRDFEILPDGSGLMFLRSLTGDDPVKCLWRLDLGDGPARVLVNPMDLLGQVEQELPRPELARRERTREYSLGISSYALDAQARLAVFSLSGRLWVADTTTGQCRELPAAGPVFDARLDPTGTQVAYVSDGALRVINVDGSSDRSIASSSDPDVEWGMAEFVAAEEMGRTRGYWWSPTGDRLLVARVDNALVSHYYICDPIDPVKPPRRIPYPTVGTPNAEVSLWLIGLDGSRIPVAWDSVNFEYLVEVSWSDQALLVLVQDRAQRRMQVLEVEPSDGSATVRREAHDEDWLHIVPGVPSLTQSDELVWSADLEGSRRLVIGDSVVTPPGLELRAVLAVDGDAVMFSASEEPTEVQLWNWSSSEGLTRVTEGSAVHDGYRRAGITVVVRNSPDTHGARVVVRRGTVELTEIESVAETPMVNPVVDIIQVGPDKLRSAVLWPTAHARGSKKLPVLLDPYGGPSSQRVLASRERYLVSQWFADQGFAVVVTDGHGTPARGLAWERSIKGDTLSLPLADQIVALQVIAADNPDLDLARVAMRGWSFGGFMATAAVLRRPDVFHAAIAGAADCDARLYDTHFKERYLGDPNLHPENYDRCSLIAEAPKLHRPLLMVHGTVDDNVVIAHGLRLSAALLAAGRPHSMIVLSGVTHMTPAPEVTKNLLMLELDFLKRTFQL